MKALIDADVIVYRVGFTTEDKDEKIAFWRANEMIKEILKAVNTKDYECFLTSQDKSNFRYQVDPLYKSNRVAPKPLHYLALREYLLEKHPTTMVTGMEADDALGISHSDRSVDTILCSLDKDLLQIPGPHYNFVKKRFATVSDVGGLQWFYKQILIGDTSDGIEGLRGIGSVKASKYLDGYTTDATLFKEVYRLYRQSYTDTEALSRIVKAGQLLKIKQHKDEPLWQPKKEWLNLGIDPALKESSQPS